MQVDGLISANGEGAGQGAAGGGSGGSIHINTELIRGYGDITVNGGDGHACTVGFQIIFCITVL